MGEREQEGRSEKEEMRGRKQYVEMEEGEGNLGRKSEGAGVHAVHSAARERKRGKEGE